MKEQSFGKANEDLLSAIKSATKNLQDGVDGAILHLQQGMQEYLADSIDLPSLMEMMEKLGLSNIMGMAETPMPGIDYYKILGLDKTASDDEVKKRYGELIKKIHPDVAGVKGTEFLTQTIVMAYNMIKKEREWNG